MKYTDQQMLDELRRAAAELGTPTMSRPAYMRVGRISAPAIAVRFGTWLQAFERAGLHSPYAYGGMTIPCPICGTPFRFLGGEKARKTCSRKCTSELMHRSRSKGDTATPQAARGRAHRIIKPRACARCGHDGSVHKIQIHHRDRNPYNNAPENLEPLCVPCHKTEHPSKRGPRKATAA